MFYYIIYLIMDSLECFLKLFLLNTVFYHSKFETSYSLVGLDILSWSRGFKKCTVFSSSLGEAEN